MKKIILVVMFLLSISSFFTNCAQSPKSSRKPVTSIEIQPAGKNYKTGDIITVILKTKIKDGNIDKINLFLDQKLIFSTRETESSYQINTTGLNPGSHLLKVAATKEDGQTGENFAELVLLSDIIPVKYGYKVINVFPHNPGHFTQGLEIHQGFLYEGTGQHGESAIYKKDMKSWKIVKEHKLDEEYFGEGITILNGKLYQLTYQSRIGFVYDLNTFSQTKTWLLKSKEGWGITNDGTSLIMSDGTEYITFLNPETFEISKRIQVSSNERFVKNINELEYIKGEIWANVWMTDKIIRIDPQTGKITGEIDLRGLLGSYINTGNPHEDVLNGIAYDSHTDKIYVTGKLWPKLFEIEIVKK